MEKRVQEEIDTIKNIIVKTLPVEQIYLFGSYAYGAPRQDSDLDFYVIMNDNAPYRDIEAMGLVDLAISGHKSIPTDVLVSKKSRFEYRLSAPTLEHEVAEKGKLIYG
ncbi:MAG: nucleotidyltransferase domain-containing protein [Candidatus Margulisbacteria bacterium]|jgi:predicted nucleotidyltransferase|nr:nucleotidyltransferase domain-containing protein [Candidatus Margulisiibacteriota bacterium]MDR1324261.1 nucleotidyltransferase domain-containing protein [Candidatus Margulisiibacteriota bacterium]